MAVTERGKVWGQLVEAIPDAGAEAHQVPSGLSPIVKGLRVCEIARELHYILYLQHERRPGVSFPVMLPLLNVKYLLLSLQNLSLQWFTS